MDDEIDRGHQRAHGELADLLQTLRDLHEDDALQAVYGIDDGNAPEAPLDAAVRAWAAAGYPGTREAT